MNESKFRTIAMYIGGLEQKLQDEIIKPLWNMGMMVARAKKQKE